MGSHGREIVGDFWGTLPQTAARRAALGSEDLAGIMARWRFFDLCPEQNNGPLCWWHSRARKVSLCQFRLYPTFSNRSPFQPSTVCWAAQHSPMGGAVWHSGAMALTASTF